MVRKQAPTLPLVLLTVLLLLCSVGRAQHWDTRFSDQGFDRWVSVLAWKGDTLFAGGDFSTAGGRKAYGVAYRIGQKWTPLPTGVDQYGYINAMKIIGDEIYIAGEFESLDHQPAGSIARYNVRDQKWSTMNGGLATSHFRPVVNDLEFDGRYLYVGGEFDTAGVVIAHDLARWDTREEHWSGLSDVIGEESEVHDLLLQGDTLFVGGRFREVNGVPTNGLVAINLGDGSVTSLSDDLRTYYSDGEVRIYAFAWMQGELYAGGRIDSIVNETRVSNVLKRQGNEWVPLGDGVWPGVYRLEVHKDHLLAYGHSEGGFEGIDGFYFAYWDGATWHYPSDHYVPGYFITRNDELTASGSFWIDSSYAHRVAKFNPSDSSWVSLDDTRTGGPRSSPYSMVAIGDNVFISGDYRQDYPGNDLANNFEFFETIEQWDGAQWITLFHQIAYDGHTLASDGRRLYTLGREGIVRDGISYFSLRAYDPLTRQWENLTELRLIGASSPQLVFAYGSLFIAAGAILPDSTVFHTAVQFDLNTRELRPMGDLRLDDRGNVNTIAAWREQVIIGGSFEINSAKNLAAYDLHTGSWHPIGSCDSMSGTVISLETYKGDLVVGGYFREVCDKPAGFIASWNGSEWSTLGGGFDESWYMTSIEDLHANGDDLYASGYFYTAGGDTVNHLARWDGTKWHAVDEASSDHDKGTNERVNRVVAVGTDVFIGGYFSTAGDIAADKFAVWRGPKGLVATSRHPSFTVLTVTDPAHDELVLDLPFDAEWRLEIFDMLGSRVLNEVTTRLDHVTIKLPSSFPCGAYFVRASSGVQELSAGFVKR